MGLLILIARLALFLGVHTLTTLRGPRAKVIARLGEGGYKAPGQRLGDFLKQQCKGYFGYIFTGNLELAKKSASNPAAASSFIPARSTAAFLNTNCTAAPAGKNSSVSFFNYLVQQSTPHFCQSA